MPDLKKISKEAIPRAIQKAERYRLLNQSWATESICLDILEVDPTNQPVLVMLVLGLFIPGHLGHTVIDMMNFALLDVVLAVLTVAVAQIVMFRRGA